MKSRLSSVSLALGSFALLAALASTQDPAKAKLGQLKDLADARVKVCERMLDFYHESLKAPAPPGGAAQGPQERYAAGYEPIELWSRRLVDAKLDGAKGVEDRITLLASEVERIKKFSTDIQAIAKNEPEWRVVADKVEFYLLDAEYRLAKEKGAQ